MFSPRFLKRLAENCICNRTSSQGRRKKDLMMVPPKKEAVCLPKKEVVYMPKQRKKRPPKKCCKQPYEFPTRMFQKLERYFLSGRPLPNQAWRGKTRKVVQGRKATKDKGALSPYKHHKSDGFKGARWRRIELDKFWK